MLIIYNIKIVSLLRVGERRGGGRKKELGARSAPPHLRTSKFHRRSTPRCHFKSLLSLQQRHGAACKRWPAVPGACSACCAQQAPISIGSFSFPGLQALQRYDSWQITSFGSAECGPVSATGSMHCWAAFNTPEVHQVNRLNSSTVPVGWRSQI